MVAGLLCYLFKVNGLGVVVVENGEDALGERRAFKVHVHEQLQQLYLPAVVRVNAAEDLLGEGEGQVRGSENRDAGSQQCSCVVAWSSAASSR
jgi:hypothetical protein